jgi:hypothetical protein
MPVASTYKINCDLHTAKDSAYCTGLRTNHIVGTATTVTTTWSSEEWFSQYKTNTATVRVTAGVEKLKAAEAKATTKTSEAATTSDSTAQTSSTNSDNAAGPAISQHVVAAGVAALIGGAAILL